MKLHANARTCPNSRRLLVGRIIEEGWSPLAAAEAAGVSERTARKWVARWRSEGTAGLCDRSSAPKRIPHRIPQATVELIEKLRRLRMTAAEIAECLGMALSTISRWLRQIGLGRLSRLQPPEPPNRYERSRPGELVHLDVKKLGRISVRGAGHRVTGHRRSQVQVGPERRGGTGWSSFMSAWMTPHAWPMPRFYPTSVDSPPRTSYDELCSGLPRWVSRSRR